MLFEAAAVSVSLRKLLGVCEMPIVLNSRIRQLLKMEIVSLSDFRNSNARIKRSGDAD